MKVYDIAEKYCIDPKAFTKFLDERGMPYSKGELDLYMGIWHIDIPDNYVNDYVEAFWEYNEQLEEERKEQLVEEENRRAVTAHMLISSGFSFDGYKIVKYSGYISGDDATQIPRSGAFGGKNGENLTKALVQIRRNALQELKDAAYDLGCNAVVGVDFDYLTLEPETANMGGGTLYEPYIICVTANGNAVVIEKIEE